MYNDEHKITNCGTHQKQEIMAHNQWKTQSIWANLQLIDTNLKITMIKILKSLVRKVACIKIW